MSLNAVADSSAERRNEALRVVSNVYSSAIELARSGNVDAVVIASPSTRHVEDAIACIERGIPVLLEKPAALTEEGVDHVEAAASKAGVPVALGLYLRHHRSAVELIEAAQALHPLIAVHCVFSNHVVLRQTVSGYEQKRALGGGALFDLAYHQFDLLNWLNGGTPSSVSARVHSHASEDDTAMIQLNWPSGMNASVFACSTTTNQVTVSAYGRNGSVHFDLFGRRGVRRSPAIEGRVSRLFSKAVDAVRALEVAAAVLPKVRLQPFIAQLADFRDAIRLRRAPRVGLGEGRDALRAVLRAYESAAANGKVIDF